MNRLSFANVGDTSRSIDWQAAQGENMEGVRVCLPTPTLSEIEQYAPELVGGEEWDLRHSDREPLNSAFEISDRFYEFEDSLFPVMSFYWPVDLPGGQDESEVAARVRAWGGCVTLVEITPEGDDSFHALALTGGGMNLSWNLAAAYMACGNVPPHALLSGLPDFGGEWGSYGIPKDVAERIVREAIPAAAEWLEMRAMRLRQLADKFAVPDAPRSPAWNSPEGQDARSRELMKGRNAEESN